MHADRKEQGTTRHSILQLLRRNGEMTALALSEVLGVGAVGIRQHLALLEREGLVRVVGLRRNVGRPAHLYALTAEAENRFPRRYDTLALDVITLVSEVAGPAALDELLALRRNAALNALAPALSDKCRREQVAALAELLAEQGYMCEWTENDDGSFTLAQFNCPVDCVARRHQQLCAHELLLYQELLDAPVAREGDTIAAGGPCCRYRVPA